MMIMMMTLKRRPWPRGRPRDFFCRARRPHRVFGWEEREDMMMTIFVDDDNGFCWSRWWFQISFIFTPIWGRFPF